MKIEKLVRHEDETPFNKTSILSVCAGVAVTMAALIVGSNKKDDPRHVREVPMTLESPVPTAKEVEESLLGKIQNGPVDYTSLTRAEQWIIKLHNSALRYAEGDKQINSRRVIVIRDEKVGHKCDFKDVDVRNRSADIF